MQIDAAFTVVTTPDRAVNDVDAAGGTTFTTRPNPGANRRVGALADRSIVQREYVPTIRFSYELLARCPELSKSRPPFKLTTGGHDVELNLHLRRYPPTVDRLTAYLSTFETPPQEFAASLIRIQELRQSGPLSDVLRRTLGMMAAQHHRDYVMPGQPPVLCALHLRLPSDTDLPAWIDTNARELVAALIRSRPQDLTQGVIESIISENRSVNEKVNTAYTLANRQGLVHISVGSRDPQPSFRTLVELQAMAAASREFLSAFSARHSDAPDLFDFYLRLLDLWVTHSSASMAPSFGGHLAWRRFVEVFQVDDLLSELLTDETKLRLQQHERFFAPLRARYWEIPDLAARLDDAVSSGPEGLELGFVADDALRRIIRRDLFEARTCLEARAFKAALVLAGSVAEALLLARIMSSGLSAKTQTKLEGLGLHELAVEMESAGVPHDGHTLALVDGWLRHYRNLIHPGRERKGEKAPSADKAALAVQAVEVLARQL